MAELRIMVLDQHMSVAQRLHRALLAMGHNPFVCADAEEALGMLKTTPAHIVVANVTATAWCGLPLSELLQVHGPDVHIVLYSHDVPSSPDVLAGDTDTITSKVCSAVSQAAEQMQ